MTAADCRALHDALLDAFRTPADFQRVVSFGLDTSLDELAPAGSLRDQVFALVEWADANNRVGDLIESAQTENPGNPKLRAFAARWKAGDVAATRPSHGGVRGLPATPDDSLRLMNFGLAWMMVAVTVLVVVGLVALGRAPWWAVLVTVALVLPLTAMFNRGLARPAGPSL